MFALVRALPDLDADTVQLHAWLRGVVRHKVADHGRQQIKQGHLLAAACSGSTGDIPAYAPESSLEAEEDRQQVLAVLDQLTDTQRMLLEWKHIDDLSVADIAVRVGQTEKSVESLLYRARREFRLRYERTMSPADMSGTNLRQETGTLEEKS